jgi:toxin-antitoxin system PIN domain toxin
MRALLDVNLLIALVDRSHIAYLLAHRWFAANRTAGWATSPIVENGCIRIITNPKYPNPFSPARALELLEQAKADAFHEFWPDDISITDPSFQRSALLGHQQVTDIYLLALAVNRSACLVTFDTGISLRAVAGATVDNLLVLPTH